MQNNNKTYYKGFSTSSWLTTSGKSFNISNIETVKQDLLNHIFTEKGERVMMPDFGTRIPTIVFEPNDSVTIDIIRTDLTEVFNYDPRVKLLNLDILPFSSNNAIIVLAELEYIEFEVKETLRIEFPTNR